jgi:1-deoxy-D-xylulose-5-phosphate synthase
MVIMAPADENECRLMLSTGHRYNGPSAVRYPRGQGTGAAISQGLNTLEIGRAESRRKGERVALLAFGASVSEAEKAADVINATLVNMRFVKPLDTELIAEMASKHDLLVTIEDNAVLGGAGSAVNEYLAKAGLLVPIINLGLPDEFMPHGQRNELLADAGLSADGIIRHVEAYLRHIPLSKHATHA